MSIKDKFCMNKQRFQDSSLESNKTSVTRRTSACFRREVHQFMETPAGR